MSHKRVSPKRLRSWQKVTALVPLALLSGAWTASLTVTGTASAAADARPLPVVPDQAIEAPASVSRPGEIAPGVPAGAAAGMVAAASTHGIPSAALAAYQRAAQVINAADPSCNLGWQLVAAIGRVESDHGRYAGNTLDEDGRSVPGIYGIPLDGSNGTAEITDTDAAQYDNDPVYDRAVGPMQFIPSTWAVVGVDADGDDVRDPQDIDDAALATAVYLCSGEEDLSTDAGRRVAVYRYNHSHDYVNLVLSIMAAYLDGEYSAVPDGAAAATVLAPSATHGAGAARPAGTKDRDTDESGTSGSGKSGTTGGGHTGSDGAADPGSPDVPGAGPDDTADPVPDTDPVKGTVEDTTQTVEESLSALDKAKITCRETFTAEEIQALGGLTACANAILTEGVGGVQDIVDGLHDIAGGLLGG